MKVSGISPKEARVVVRRAIKAGCTVELSGGNHLLITTPSGVVVRGALTGSHNSAIYLYRDLKKAGLDLSTDRSARPDRRSGSVFED